MGKRARWILVGVVLLAVVAVGWMKLRHGSEPIARWALADGTELRLQYVTYGTEHRIAGVGKIGVLSARLANQWLHTRFPYYQDEYLVKTDTPCPVLWFTAVDPQTGKLTQPKIESVAALGEPGAVRMRTNGGGTNGNAPFPNAARPLTAFPRRAESIRLRIDVGGQIFEGNIPNPARGQRFDEWKPEPMPQTRRIGTREFNLDRLTLHRWTEGFPKGLLQCSPSFSIREVSGEAADGFSISSELLDATGNQHIEILPLDEPAWKVRAYFRRSGGYPFAANEGLTLGPVEMPGPGEYREFAVSADEKKSGIRLAAIFGKGHFIWDDGKFLTAETVAVTSGGGTGVYGPGSHVRMDKVFYEPHLMFLLEGTRAEKWVKSSEQLVVRLHIGGRGYEMHSSGGSGGNQYIEKLFISPWDKRGNRIPLSGPVSIQIVPVEPEIVEFIVAPPPLPETKSEAPAR